MGAGLCDGEGERAYAVNDPILGGERYLNYFKRIQTLCRSKNLAKAEQFDLRIFVLFSISLFAHTKIPSQNTPPVKPNLKRFFERNVFECFRGNCRVKITRTKN